ncbi:hypothetical protein J6TS1_36190 [Siminovitchia terrae]|uniref:Uncharacterized protein n=1 Tax=Siminovitchia terrae TaxID=1914933 RepID=A0ABQ4L1J9_SIMTE|nr:hypothetical protein J22TS1_20230 [Siminovitchia terrae]GIN97749.1 hypothetical protein J6TS1_36190 [Siminovitchia terrae]
MGLCERKSLFTHCHHSAGQYFSTRKDRSDLLFIPIKGHDKIFCFPYGGQAEKEKADHVPSLQYDPCLSIHYPFASLGARYPFI